MDAITLLSCAALLAAAPEANLPAETPALVHSANFVVNAPDRPLAEAVLKQAEALRHDLAVAWLGGALPPSVGTALIRVKLSDGEDIGTAWVAQSADRLSHVVWLTTSRERATGSTLAHEMTHVVLATQYPGRVPAWFDEAAASLADDAERKTTRRELLAWFARTGNWPPLAQTLSAARIEHTDQKAYAVSSSLADYLLTFGDRQKLLTFALEGKQQGWQASLTRHYGIASFDALQTGWQRFVLDQARREQAAAASPGAILRTAGEPGPLR